ncbi:hypothetical protein OOT00_06170 [Desulfobotulus sp. H1]|uniref:Uncharacterized protein n=1 Tax=Desulfobotulus pelophilus TaxID=2823377 RepID=A0ABT3N801_9BACT|nr:hypothetical protein [Desulfobotulus pelophilus]MCW7753574.1 hypothetical protein [Desulfobotulus pelophilus]
MMYDTLSELLEARFSKKAPEEPVVFIHDEELARLDEFITPGADGQSVFNAPLVMQKAALLGYWCEADWDEKGGGFVFAIDTKR